MNKFTRTVFLIVLFLTAFLLSGLVIDRIMPEFPINDVSEKFSVLARKKDEINILFLGNSRIYRNIHPRVFDQSMSDLGFSTNSYNFGVPGLRGDEAIHIMGKISRMKMPNLEWVFIDCNTTAAFSWLDETSKRSIQFHDLKTTGFAIRLIWLSNMNLFRKFDQTWKHIKAFFYHISNQNRSVELINSLRAKKKPRRRALFEHGFFSANTDIRIRQRHKEFLSEENLKQYENAVEKLKNKKPQIVPPGKNSIAFVNQITRIIKKAGAAPIFIISPNVRRSVQEDLSMNKHPLLIFNSPNEYPEFFSLDYRYDWGHLNRKGAVWFSHLLAQKFSEILTRSKDQDVVH